MRRIAVILLLAAAGLGYLIYSLNQPYGGFRNETFVDIPKGSSTRQMAEMLQQAGVIRHTWEFLLARSVYRRRTLQAGEYRFQRPASPLEVFDRIARGDVFYHDLVVPEGNNMFDIAQLAQTLGLFPAEEFLAAARDPSDIRDLDPRAPTQEGYLFPSTYRVSRHTTPQKLCRMMTGKFREVWHGLKTDADAHRSITLASLVEKEGKLPEERPVIASVFERRLEIGMKLDCDPTTIYAALVAGRYRGTIYRSDLESANPYNTYQHAGLPPGPIANPGVASIQAVLHPAGANYLYFVARPDGSGGHTFSESIAAHEQATAKYRRANHQTEIKKKSAGRVLGRQKPRRNRGG